MALRGTFLFSHHQHGHADEDIEDNPIMDLFSNIRAEKGEVDGESEGTPDNLFIGMFNMVDGESKDSQNESQISLTQRKNDTLPQVFPADFLKLKANDSGDQKAKTHPLKPTSTITGIERAFGNEAVAGRMDSEANLVNPDKTTDGKEASEVNPPNLEEENKTSGEHKTGNQDPVKKEYIDI
jgi:hypothetical protein